jgi:2OG-Fe(II) oxygenase superfamily
MRAGLLCLLQVYLVCVSSLASVQECLVGEQGECGQNGGLAGNDGNNQSAQVETASQQQQQTAEQSTQQTQQQATEREAAEVGAQAGAACYDEDADFCDQFVNNMTDADVACMQLWKYTESKCRFSCFLCDNVEFPQPGQVLVNHVFDVQAQLAEGKERSKTLKVIKQSEDYMYNKFYKETKLPLQECRNQNQLCSYWASQGECESNPSYMTFSCGPACRTCEQMDFGVRCPYSGGLEGAWNETGDLTRAFYRIATDPSYQQYAPTIHSAPAEYVAEFTNDTHTPQEGPWVIVLENFLTEKECETLIELGAISGYERSEGVGSPLPNGTYVSTKTDIRTSTNSWCTDDCFEDPASVAVHERIREMTKVPIDNYEYLQMLKYEVGQFYRTHHDYIAHHRQRAPGPRIMTVFLYLNDVEAGGGTQFPRLKGLVSL